MLDLEKTCLIITGTVSPSNDVYALKLKNQNERMEQYISSIRYYILNTKIKNIIFCDNSNTYSNEIDNLKEIARTKNKNFEYLYFLGNTQKVIEQGKGYGEGEIINYILDNSQIIKYIKTIIKVTGRIKVKNLNLLLNLSKKNINYFNTIYTNLNICDTRIYIINIEDYKKYFINGYKNVDDRNRHWLEHEFKDIIKKNNIKYKLFPILPNIDGISGSTGEKYKDSKKYYIKKILSKFNMYGN
jgi:hypothetical protein